MRTHRSLAFTTILASSLFVSLTGQGRPAPKVIEVATGVYVFVTPSYGDVGLDGNSIAIVSDAGVLVFDSNGTPAASAAVLAEIRKLTSQPVRFLVYSHWHWDHWYGTETYAQAFPAVQIVAHEKTRSMMIGPALDFNQPGLERDLPNYIDSLERKSAASPNLRSLIEQDRFFLEQKKNVHHVFPNFTFSDKVTLNLGSREVQVMHADRAVTPGDSFLYLPAERIVVSGDLLVNPISFALSCYPTGWLRTLEQIVMMSPSVIIPGHGEPLRDRQLLHATMEVFRQLLRRGKEFHDRNVPVDEAKAAILPGLHDLMVTITRDDKAANDAFAVQLVDWYLHRVYDELDGPLTDDIAPIPRS